MITFLDNWKIQFFSRDPVKAQLIAITFTVSQVKDIFRTESVWGERSLSSRGHVGHVECKATGTQSKKQNGNTSGCERPNPQPSIRDLRFFSSERAQITTSAIWRHLLRASKDAHWVESNSNRTSFLGKSVIPKKIHIQHIHHRNWTEVVDITLTYIIQRVVYAIYERTIINCQRIN